MLQAPADVGRLPTLTVKYTLYQCALKHAYIYSVVASSFNKYANIRSLGYYSSRWVKFFLSNETLLIIIINNNVKNYGPLRHVILFYVLVCELVQTGFPLLLGNCYICIHVNRGDARFTSNDAMIAGSEFIRMSYYAHTNWIHRYQTRFREY